jgi:hypothetical protein
VAMLLMMMEWSQNAQAARLAKGASNLGRL